ncbi:alpha,alpha-trehalose-phosphate synthase (UDP-forming) [Rubrobacter aplysinae]|uniref:alpha,alpha-trehalose-phosphate synthase (UDP-forming) n=1 Tax=Rubrobacter aplysinae TaxID=909625 RepID=UPI00064B8E1D|nr:trehalose-6-phosphate synthase [Rubrobacter aplysinae]
MPETGTARGDPARGPQDRFIIVSNRGPVTFSREEGGGRTYSRGAGGLVTALNAMARNRDAVWIASATSGEDVVVAREEEPVEIGDLTVDLVEHDPEAYELMYNHVANPLLWFVQHGIYDLPYSPRLGDDTRRAWEGYEEVNRNFARAAADAAVRAAESGEEPVVLLHDYQLYMVPGSLREGLRGTAAEGAFVSLFVHIPWPDPGYWRILPQGMREGILESLLQCDVLAFHTEGYARCFLDTVSEVLGAEVDLEGRGIQYRGRETRVRAYPISIDPAEFSGLAESEAVLAEEEYVQNLPGSLLLRVDRLDLSKNVLRGFLAYGRMLERYPHMRERVTFLAQLQPSRGSITEYARYSDAVRQAVEEINGAHRTPSWEPVILSLEDNFLRSVAAYKNYDALLVNAVRDGMNLVAKEAAVVNRRDGVLVLSETAGAHEELGEHALTVNPFDLDEQADALHRALIMDPVERRSRAQSLRASVERNTVDDWVEAQMTDIAALRGHSRRGSS